MEFKSLLHSTNVRRRFFPVIVCIIVSARPVRLAGHWIRTSNDGDRALRFIQGILRIPLDQAFHQRRFPDLCMGDKFGKQFERREYNTEGLQEPDVLLGAPQRLRLLEAARHRASGQLGGHVSVSGPAPLSDVLACLRSAQTWERMPVRYITNIEVPC